MHNKLPTSLLKATCFMIGFLFLGSTTLLAEDASSELRSVRVNATSKINVYGSTKTEVAGKIVEKIRLQLGKQSGKKSWIEISADLKEINFGFSDNKKVKVRLKVVYLKSENYSATVCVSKKNKI